MVISILEITIFCLQLFLKTEKAPEQWISDMNFIVRGVPSSYMRDATPGNMSTVVKLVEYVG